MTAGHVLEPADLTPQWLTVALGRPVRGVRAEPVGTGQIGAVYRLYLDGDGAPTTVLAKLPAADPASRDLMAGAYRGEVRFYAEIAPTVAVRVPACRYAAVADEGGGFTLLLEDLAPRQQGDQIAGCSVTQARDAVVNLAGLHGPRWCDAGLLEIENLSLSGPDDAALLAELYGPAVDLFLEGLGELVSAEDAATLRDCVAVTEAWALARPERFGLVHGDYRLDNLLFPPDGADDTDGADDDVVAVDWQTLSLGLPARDLAYFLGTALEPAERAAHERDLVAAYHQALLGFGVTGYDLDTCWDDYRFAMLQGPLVSVFGCAYGAHTPRGDRMFATMIRRSCAAIRDLGSLTLVG